METILLRADTLMTTPGVATIGMFDGVHRGHQQLIGRVVTEARRLSLPATVITFDRAPRQVLDPSFRPELLSTAEEKAEAIAGLGVDRLVVLSFSREMASLSARQFMGDILLRQLAIRHLVTGYDNRFGHNREEGFDDYVAYGRELGMTVERGEAVMTDDGSQTVSSSVIRGLLKQGRVDTACRLLTRHYQLSGTVVGGEHIGHRLGFPTANLRVDNPLKLIPLAGVYVVKVRLTGEQGERPAMMNIGTRPTFEGHRQTLEINIIDYDGNLYGQPLTVSFHRRLREERRFNSEAELIAQLETDRSAVTSTFSMTL